MMVLGVFEVSSCGPIVFYAHSRRGMVVVCACSKWGCLVPDLSGARARSECDDGFRSEWVLAAGLIGIPVPVSRTGLRSGS